MYNKKLKLVCAAFGLALAFTSAPLIAPMTDVYAATITTSTTQDGISYTMSDNNITIIGYSGTSTKVDLVKSFESIEGTITKIANKAFKGNTQITSVIIPEGCTYIGESAFCECTALRTVEIQQEGDLVLGKAVFSGCSSLTTLKWDGVTETTIPDWAFSNTAISAIKLPQKTTSIGKAAFYECKSLTSIVIPASCSSIIGESGYGAFESSGLKSVTFKEGGEDEAEELTIGAEAFRDTDLRNVELPARCTSIQKYAFYIWDGGLDTITLHSNVTLNEECLTSFNGQQDTIVYGCDSYTNAIKYVYLNSSDHHKLRYQIPCSEIKIKEEPTKTRYTYGDTEDLITGLQIEAIYEENADNNNLSAILKKQEETDSVAQNYASNLIVTGYNKNQVGPQTITVEYGNAKATFKVYVRYDLSTQATVTLADESASRVYTGSEIKPAIVAKNGNTTINAGWYEVSYSNNTNASKERAGSTTSFVDKTQLPTVTLSAKNDDYVIGKKDFNFDIYAKNINATDVMATVKGSHVFSGAAINLNADEISLTYNDESIPFIVNGCGNNTNVTTATSKANCSISVDTDKTKNYTGSKIVNYDIEPLSLSDMIEKEILSINTGNELTYNGQPQKPLGIILTRKSWIEGDEDILLTENYAYTIESYSNNINAGKAMVTIVGVGNYTGTVKAEYTINPASIEGTNIAVSSEKTYNSEILKPDVEVVFGSGEDGKPLVEGTDYTVSVTSKKNSGDETAPVEPVAVGDYIVTIKGKGNFEGTVTKDYTIKPIVMDNATFTVENEYAYTGEAICPEIEVKLGDAVLSAETDYDVTYKDNIKPGIATVTVTGKGGYAGTVTRTFKVLGKPLYVKDAEDNAVITAIPDQDYDYKGVKPAIEVKKGDVTLVEGRDYEVAYTDNDKLGEGTVTVTGIDYYSGTLIAKYNIVAKNVAACNAMLDAESYTYTGEAITPVVKVMFGADSEKELVVDTDYEVAYADNTKIGKATITITGKGNYTGVLTKTFEIKAIELKKCTIGVDTADKTYTGQEIKPAVEVKDGNKNLAENVDYKVVYADNINAGTATVTIIGIGNYSGKVDKTFEIKANQIPASSTQTPSTQAPSAETPSTETPVQNVVLVKGDVITVSTVVYQIVVPATDGTGEVAYKGLSDEEKVDATTAVIPDKVMINGEKYNVTSIKTGTFKNCKKLKKIVIGKNIKTIEKQAFAGCKNLKTIEVKSTKFTKKTIKKDAFKGIKKSTTIKIPKKKYKEYKKLFQQKGLTKGVKIRK